ncbi:MAG: GxxExxY protein [Prevotella sp.]|nr:GxxExxY protein [Prevotella sp.]
MDVEKLIKEILDSAREVRKELKQGFEEKVYKNALFLELKDRGLSVMTEVEYDVRYKNRIVGQYKADMVVDDSVVVELKANNSLCAANEVQLVNYLNASGIEDGLLINFGGDRLEVKRKFRTYRPKQE